MIQIEQTGYNQLTRESEMNPLNEEVEVYESISKAIGHLKTLARNYETINKPSFHVYCADIKALYKIRENYIIAKSIDLAPTNQ